MKEVISDQSSVISGEKEKVDSKKLVVRRGLIDGVIIQVVLGVLCAAMLDGGMAFQMWFFSMVAYWPVAILTILRQSHKPISSDPYVLRWGFLALDLLFTPVISVIVWHYRGVL